MTLVDAEVRLAGTLETHDVHQALLVVPGGPMRA